MVAAASRSASAIMRRGLAVAGSCGRWPCVACRRRTLRMATITGDEALGLDHDLRVAGARQAGGLADARGESVGEHPQYEHHLVCDEERTALAPPAHARTALRASGDAAAPGRGGPFEKRSRHFLTTSRASRVPSLCDIASTCTLLIVPRQPFFEPREGMVVRGDWVEKLEVGLAPVASK